MEFFLCILRNELHTLAMKNIFILFKLGALDDFIYFIAFLTKHIQIHKLHYWYKMNEQHDERRLY